MVEKPGKVRSRKAAKPDGPAQGSEPEKPKGEQIEAPELTKGGKAPKNGKPTASSESKDSCSWCMPVFIGTLIILMFGLKFLGEQQSYSLAGTDYYALLGVGKKATSEEIRKAYRKATMEWHPDKCIAKGVPVEECEEKSSEILVAYEVLSKPALRRYYDDMKHVRMNPALYDELKKIQNKRSA